MTVFAEIKQHNGQSTALWGSACKAADAQVLVSTVQSSDDENLMDQIHAPSPHARSGLQPSSSTPALPTHLARMSETADANANYARGTPHCGTHASSHAMYSQVLCLCLCAQS